MATSPVRSVGPPPGTMNGNFLTGLSLCGIVLALSTGCASAPNPRDMTEVERARAINTRRKQADYEFSTFQASEGEDIEALKRYAERHVETTKFAPGSCDRCFFNAGIALAQVGSYYRAEVLALDLRLQDAIPAETKRMQVEIDDLMRVMRRYFLESNRNFEIYFFQVGALVDASAYWRIADNHAALEDWRRALRYLDLFEQAAPPLAEGKSDLKVIRDNFRVKLRLQEEQQLDEELRRSGRSRRSKDPQLSN